jgi:hypothetical protein
VTAKGHQYQPAFRIPQLRGHVHARGNDAPAIGAERCVPDLTLVTAQTEQLPPICGVPNRHQRSVASKQAFPIRTEGHAGSPARGAQREQLPAVFRIPQRGAIPLAVAMRLPSGQKATS